MHRNLICVLGVSFFISLLGILNGHAEERTYRVITTPPTATVVPVEDPYEWSYFQDVAILPGTGNATHVAFAVRKGRLKNTQSEYSKLGLWYGWQDVNANWHARGVFRELTDYIRSIRELNFRASTVANITPVDTMTACQDDAKNSHIFIQVFQVSPQGMDPRLVYVRYTPQGNYKVKLSSTVSDDMGHTMQCVADAAGNIHLFGVKRWNQDYSRIVSYKLAPSEQTRQSVTFQMMRSELPQNFETRNFSVFRSSSGMDLAFFKQSNIALSLARHGFQGRDLASASSGWGLFFDNNIRPNQQPNLMHDELHGFSYGGGANRMPQSHLIGKYKDIRSDGSPQRGIAYYYQDASSGFPSSVLGGKWKSKGMVMNVDLYTLSVTALKERPVFYMLGTTHDAEIWSGYYHVRDQRWVNQGVVFRRNSQ